MKGWTFTTKKTPPSMDSARLVVSADGTGDFNTVQGAIDFVPDRNPRRVTIFIRSGMYEEIVYFRNKTNVTFLGEDREKVQVFYANNEVFNPHPSNISTNEWPGTFPSRRAAFMADNSSGIHLVNLSIKTTARGQAEGLLIMGDRNIVSHVTITGSGDALQVNGSVYLTHSLIIGDGDTILGRGPAFFNRCELQSRGVFMWIRNTSANHGNVFLNSTFRKLGAGTTELARAPINNGRAYPNAEAVLINSTLDKISPVGWGAMGGDTTNMHYWEYNSTNVSDGKPVDISQRKPESRQLTVEKDAELIANYSNPAYVLGWTPAMAPMILSYPEPVTAAAGQSATLAVKVAAIPALRGKYVFGDITTGRLWYADLEEMVAADDGNPATLARLHELKIRWNGETYATMFPIVETAYHTRGGKDPDLPGSSTVSGNGRADIRFATDAAGELYILSKSDGVIRAVVAVTGE